MNSRNAWLSPQVRLVEGVKKWEYIRGFSFPNLYLVRVEKSRNNNNKFVDIYYMPLLIKKKWCTIKTKRWQTKKKKKTPKFIKKRKIMSKNV